MAGTYTFYAAGYGANQPRLDSTSITITLEVDEVPDFDNNYKARWELTYDNLTDSTYKVEVLERGYTGEVETVKGGSMPSGYNQRGQGNDVYELSILSSNVNFNLIAETFDQFKDIALADEKKYVLRNSTSNGVTYDTTWFGYVTPSSYQDVLYDTPYPVSVSANDRLGDLKGFKFLFGSNNSNNFVRGNLSQLSIINICLKKLFLGFGYRIACNIFAENHTTTDATPLDQTLLNVDTYLNDDATDVAFCDEVIKDILEIYGATLFSWEGYWYIVRQEEWLNETINYVQYNSNIEFESNGSWNPRIDLKRPNDTNRARLINGQQSRIFTQLYSSVNLTQRLDLISVEGNVLNPIDSSNIIDFDPGNVGNPNYSGFDLINNGSNLSSQYRDGGSSWELDLKHDFGSKSYIETTGKIQYTDVDQLEFESTVNLSTFIVPRIQNTNTPIYAQLKWSLKIADKWVGRSGALSDEEIINIEFVDSFNSDFKIETLIDMSTSSADGGDDYALRVYPVDIEENHLQVSEAFESGFVDQVKPIPTANLEIGTRLTVLNDYDLFVEGNTIRFIRFYELAFGSISEDDPNVGINPSDQSSTIPAQRLWAFVSSYYPPFPGKETKIDGTIFTTPESGANTKTKFKEIKLSYKRSGKDEIEEEFVVNRIGEGENNRELNYEINQFDIPEINNGQKIIKNFLKYEDLTPTSLWTKTGGDVTKSIQSHLLDWLTRLAKRCRGKVSGNFRTDGVDFTPINILHDPDDNNRLYLPTGVNSNYKLQEYSGELLEIGSGDDLGTSAYSSGFKQNSFR